MLATSCNNGSFPHSCCSLADLRIAAQGDPTNAIWNQSSVKASLPFSTRLCNLSNSIRNGAWQNVGAKHVSLFLSLCWRAHLCQICSSRPAQVSDNTHLCYAMPSQSLITTSLPAVAEAWLDQVWHTACSQPHGPHGTALGTASPSFLFSISGLLHWKSELRPNQKTSSKYAAIFVGSPCEHPQVSTIMPLPCRTVSFRPLANSISPALGFEAFGLESLDKEIEVVDGHCS